MNLNKYIENLKEKYGDKNLPEDVKKEAIKFYKKCVNSYYHLDGEIKPIVTFNHTLVAEGYKKIVFLDYGPFLYVPEELICWDNLIPKEHQFKPQYVIFVVDNYPNFECIYVKNDDNKNEEEYLLIPLQKVFPVQSL